MKQYSSVLEKELDELLGEDISSVIDREKKQFDWVASPFEKSLVLFGAGNFGRRVLAQLRKDGIEPLAFVDNNKMAWGKYVDGIEIFSPQDAAEKFGQRAAFVVTIWNTEHSFVETRKQLWSLDCAKVISAVPLRWKYSETLLPFYWLDVPSKTSRHASRVRSVYSLWADEFSQKEYVAQLKYRILGEFDSLSAPVPQESYFPDDLYELLPDEVFIDCGAYDGTTLKHFLERQPQFLGRIVAYEPDPINFHRLEKYISGLGTEKNRITALPYAVGEKKSQVRFDAAGTMGSTISNLGSVEVDCVSLDENLSELHLVPTFIKMDIEGGELDALAGARNLIQKEAPVLAICLYHRYDDLWRIPLYINALSNEYRLFLRPHEIEGWQLVCYAIPMKRIKAHR